MSHLGLAENTDSLTLHSLTPPAETHTQPTTQQLLNKVDIKKKNIQGKRVREFNRKEMPRGGGPLQ